MKRPTLEISIAPHRGKPNIYVASYASELLHSVYRLEFPDTVMGAVALHTFAEMLTSQAPESRVSFLLPEDDRGLRPAALRDALVLSGNVRQ